MPGERRAVSPTPEEEVNVCRGQDGKYPAGGQEAWGRED